jgi:hypothetical protein
MPEIIKTDFGKLGENKSFQIFECPKNNAKLDDSRITIRISNPAYLGY